jgi:DNA-binding response OmpR family regulator
MGRPLVFIVDDDRSWTQSVTQLLDDAGFAVQAASDGEEAIELLATAQPALVLLDVHMPRIDGIQLLRQLRERDCQTPVLMISAEDQASTQDRAMAAGATAFLRKPISVSLLLRAVRRYVANADEAETRR